MDIFNPSFLVAGLDPAIHVFVSPKREQRQDVDARVKPGQGTLDGVVAV